ncbi:multiple antibiotic resistance protein [Candidatus Methanophagaceae archaeon]|nr:multiple antibiotic resistance protein [Methanophagales archaeon]
MDMDLALSLVQVFIMLFVIMDPPGCIPIFMALTKDVSKEERERELNHAVAVASILLLLFAFLGKVVLDVLGITLNSFMIAGGILLLFIAFDLLRGEHKYGVRGGPSVGAVPLGIPLLAGPGAITAVMVIIQSYGVCFVLFAIFSAIIATKLVLGQSERIFRIIGKVGSEVLSRVMGIIVAAIAIQFIMDGIVGMIF